MRQPNLSGMFIRCFLAVGALFFCYDIVERTWLGQVGPEMLNVLHILRGFSAAAIASVLATLILLRQTHDTVSKALPSSSRKSWKHRLQNVGLRTKIAVPMVALAVIPTATVGIFTISSMQRSLSESAIRRLTFDTDSKARRIREFLEALQEDLRFLSRLEEVRRLVAAQVAEPPERLDILRQKVTQKFLLFSQGKRAFYQVRYLDGAGREVVRLNVEDGVPRTVSSGQLQDKSGRYYVKAALALEPGQVFVSPMDLNFEHGKAESPPRGVVRYAMNVAGEGGAGRGLLIINVYADYLLSLIGPLAPGAKAWLVDRNATYLGYVGESEEGSNPFSIEKGRRLSRDYTPEQTQALLADPSGRLPIKTEAAFVSHASIAISPREPERRWVLVVGYPRARVEGPIRQLATFLLIVMAFVIAVAAVLGVLIGDYLARPIARLQRATRDIAAGHTKEQVDITTGDEIERLADDFNAMTWRLSEAQEKLSAWNLELKKEVERQTGLLQRLQGGIARADKLASIGQITAGVMHEVGNPLAAIKAKIQVAREDDDLCEECEGLLSEILEEVDRLAIFLRSFSRLARLGGPQVKRDVSLSEVAEGVVDLISTDLRKKGLVLRREIAADVPKISGAVDQLRQLLMNLILNAADASRDAGEITVRVKRAGPASAASDLPDGVRLEVEDGGQGIHRDILDKIWDPFFTTKDDGTGLGLAICRQIVEDHNGTIRIESEAGAGTLVVVNFPGRIIETSEATPVARHPAPDKTQRLRQP